MLKNIIFITASLLLPALAHAEEKNIPNKGKVENIEKPASAKSEKISIQAKGMVCSFCAQGIEKKFKALDQVAGIKVSLETKKIDVDLKEGKSVTDDDIKKILTESGYEVVKIERNK